MKIGTQISLGRDGTRIKRATKTEFGWFCEVLDAGTHRVVRTFECATLDEARRCEQGLTRKPSPSRQHSPVYSKPLEVEQVNNDT